MYDKKCYVFIRTDPIPVDEDYFLKIYANCLVNGAELVSVDSQDEQDFLMET